MFRIRARAAIAGFAGNAGSLAGKSLTKVKYYLIMINPNITEHNCGSTRIFIFIIIIKLSSATIQDAGSVSNVNYESSGKYETTVICQLRRCHTNIMAASSIENMCFGLPIT